MKKISVIPELYANDQETSFDRTSSIVEADEEADEDGCETDHIFSKYVQKCPFVIQKFVVKHVLSKLFHMISHHPCNRGRQQQLQGIDLAISLQTEHQ